MLICGSLILTDCPAAHAVNSFAIGWDPNAENDLDGYGIYLRKEIPGPPYLHYGDVFLDELSDSDNPQFTLTDFEDGIYYIAATALDDQGNESDFSKHLKIRVSGSEITHVTSEVSSKSSDSGGGGG